MDCNHARLLLLFARKPADLDLADAEALGAHLDQCPDCQALAGAEERVDQALGRAIRDVAVPASLRERLLTRLQQERRVVWRYRLAAAGGLAAALLLTAGLAWAFWLGKQPEVDLNAFQDMVSIKVAAAPEQVEQWFQEQGVAMKAPTLFNYHLLYTYDTTHFMNRRVAKLIFVHRDSGSTAAVYVLSRTQFDWKSEELPPSIHTSFPSNHTIEPLPEDPDYLFLAVFTGGSLDPFRKPDGI
jgi:anti-sigma factor (TIGR02949 family)